jgi:hypothetical protein
MTRPYDSVVRNTKSSSRGERMMCRGCSIDGGGDGARLLIQGKGGGLGLTSARMRSRAAWSETTGKKMQRLRRSFVSLAKSPSSAFSQDAEVGTKWKVQCGCRLVDLKLLHAKIGELALEKEFLFGVLSKAGLLSAKP